MLLQERIFAGITLDRCPQCAGLWFDDGEVGQIVERWQAGSNGAPEVVNELEEGFRRDDGAETRRRGLLSYLRHALA
jgi:Zn-finger nucleic acid-binding protein